MPEVKTHSVLIVVPINQQPFSRAATVADLMLLLRPVEDVVAEAARYAGDEYDGAGLDMGERTFFVYSNDPKEAERRYRLLMTEIGLRADVIVARNPSHKGAE